MTKKISIAIILLLYVLSNLFAQDKIVLISGKVLDGKILKEGADTIKYQFSHKGKTEESFVESYRVFSIQYSNGKENVIYKYDTIIGNDRTEEQLRSFIYGEQDAWRGYHPGFTSAMSFAIAGVAAFLINGNVISFVVLVVPFATYMAFVLLVRPGADKNTVRDPKYLTDPDYIEGYRRIAKSKKNRVALWGSILGTGAGIGVWALSQKNVF